MGYVAEVGGGGRDKGGRKSACVRRDKSPVVASITSHQLPVKLSHVYLVYLVDAYIWLHSRCVNKLPAAFRVNIGEQVIKHWGGASDQKWECPGTYVCMYVCRGEIIQYGKHYIGGVSRAWLHAETDRPRPG